MMAAVRVSLRTYEILNVLLDLDHRLCMIFIRFKAGSEERENAFW